MKKWIMALICITLLFTITISVAAAGESESTSLVTKEAPDFTAQAVMPDNSITDLTLPSYSGKYVILFFYPLDFTFVCPSEIIAFTKT